MVKNSKKEGRPIEFTDDVVKKLEEAFAIDATVEEACFYADISRQSYYNNVKEGTDLFDRFIGLRNRPVLKARQTVVKALDNPHDAQWYLTRKKKLEFGDNVDVTTGGEKLPQPLLNISNLVKDVIPTDNSTKENSKTE